MHTPAMEGHFKFCRGGEILNGKIFKGKYKLEFPEGLGRGVETQWPHG